MFEQHEETHFCGGSRHWCWGNGRVFWKRREPHCISPWRAAYTDLWVGQTFGKGLSGERPGPTLSTKASARRGAGWEWAGEACRWE